MRILLISVNRERMPFPVFPLGLAYIAGALKEGGHQIALMDLCFSQGVSADLNNPLHRFQPDLIGISLRNGLLSQRGGGGCWDLSSILFLTIGHRRFRIFFSPPRASPKFECRFWNCRRRRGDFPPLGKIH